MIRSLDPFACHPSKWVLGQLTLLLVLSSCADDRPPVILETTLVGTTANPMGPYEVSSVIKDDGALASARLYFGPLTEGGVDYLHQDMVPSGGDLYVGSVGAWPIGTTIMYYVEATDEGGNGTVDPVGAPLERAYSFQVVAGECLNDANCGPNARCVLGACVAGCMADSDCPPAMVCSDGLCVLLCAEDLECAPGQICEGEVCVEGCRTDSACPSGYRCQLGHCLPQCLSDLECPSGEVCDNGTCVPGCSNDDECPLGEICQEGQCVSGCHSWADCPPGLVCDDGLCVSPILCQDDDLEENDTSEMARAIGLGTFSRLMVCGADQDWYRLSIAGGSQLTVSLDWTTLLQLEIYDAQSGGYVTSGQVGGGRIQAEAEIDADATLNLLIWSPSGVDQAYDLTVTTVPLVRDLCDPCRSDLDCGGALDRCVHLTLPGEESFCGQDCSDDARPCPEGYFCYNPRFPVPGLEVENGDYQCLPEAWTCGLAGCRDDEGCLEGEICLDGECMVGCRDDEDCLEGEICLDGECMAGCRDDEDCLEGEICRDGECMAGCRDDEDCPEGEICRDGECVVGCRDDEDCLEGEICRDGECVVGCRDDEDCPEGYRCLQNVCILACEDDGYEDNDDLSQAPLLLEAGVVQGLAICPGDHDWFAFALGKGDRLDVYIALDSAQGALGLRLVWWEGDNGPHELAVSATGGDIEHVSLVEAGQSLSYAIEVFGVSPEVQNAYTLKVEIMPNGQGGELCQPCFDDEDCGGEQDDCLPLGEEHICGRYCDDGEACPDGYGCIVREPRPQCQPLSLTCEPQWVCRGDEDCPPGWTCDLVSGVCLPPMCHDDDSEPNSSADLATPLVGALEGRMLCGGDEDWYRVEVPARASLVGRVVLGADEVNLDLDLLAQDGMTLLRQSRGEGAIEEVGVPAVAFPSVYYLRVLGRTLADEGAYEVEAIVVPGGGLCAPCDRDQECGAEGDLCLTLGDQRVCGRQCDGPQGCEEGYLCDVDLLPPQCVPASGLCPMACFTEDDCPAGYHCDSGACRPRECDDDALEPNDEPEVNATPVGEGAVEGLVACPGNPDWYTLRLLAGDTLEVTVRFAPGASLDLALYNQQLRLLGDVATGSGLLVGQVLQAVGGTYYFRVTGDQEAVNYELEVRVLATRPCEDDDLEPNDRPEGAEPVVSGDYPGLKICRGDEDWYALDMEGGQTIASVQILFANQAGNLDMELYDPDANLVGSSATDRDMEEVSLDHVREAGRYLVRVLGRGGVENDYSLLVRLGVGLCEPCGNDAECGTEEDVCLLGFFPDGQGHCLWDCFLGQPCPEGYYCSELDATTRQCMPWGEVCR